MSLIRAIAERIPARCRAPMGPVHVAGEQYGTPRPVDEMMASTINDGRYDHSVTPTLETVTEVKCGALAEPEFDFHDHKTECDVRAEQFGAHSFSIRVVLGMVDRR